MCNTRDKSASPTQDFHAHSVLYDLVEVTEQLTVTKPMDTAPDKSHDPTVEL